MVERTAVNPWNWSLAFGFNQGELVEGATRTLYCLAPAGTLLGVASLAFPELLIEIEATAVA